MSNTPVEINLENVKLQPVQAYRTVYALTDIKRGTDKLHATHFVACLEYGRNPMWGVFSAVTGKLIAKYASKSWVQWAYPKKIFRRIHLMTTTTGNLFQEVSREKREQLIEGQVDKNHPFDERPLSDDQRERLHKMAEEKGCQSL